MRHKHVVSDMEVDIVFPNTAKFMHSLGPCSFLKNLFSLHKLLSAAAWLA